VTLLISGLPLVQIELKRRGLEMKEAFNQINRYQRHSFWTARGVFSYVQIFVISNGVNTKYYANETILIEPYEDYVRDFNKGVEALKSVAPTVASVDALEAKPKILERKIIIERVTRKLLDLIATFDDV
jgi:type I restriction enzyme, R subunit